MRRRTTDRVIGGVADGLGDYFNVDPLLFRIGFVGLMIFGGAGLVIYLIAWLLLPAEGHDDSMLESFLRRLKLTPGRIVGLAVLVVFFILLVNSWNTGMGFSLQEGPLGIPGAIWALGIVMTGVLLLRRRGIASTAPLTAPALPVAAAPQVHVAKAPPRPPSPLAWYTYGAALLSIGLLAVVSQVAERNVSPGQFFGAALAVLGIGLVIGAWWGRARILILLVLLLLPLGAVASFITTPLEGGIGDHEYAPVTVAELRDEYRSLGGRIILDLTKLSTSTRDLHISASVAVGQLMVILPQDASVELHTHVGAGDSIVLGTQDIGTSLDNRYVRRHLNRTTYILDLEAGIGEVYVQAQGGN
jgi:phage shock protein PspC (stress-responsive transcriptional regulator)